MKTPVNIIIATAVLLFNVVAKVQAEGANIAAYTFHSYGLTRGDKKNDNAANIVNNKWHISYKMVAGCIVDKELVDKAKRNNDSVKNALSKVYGTDWEQKRAIEIKQEETLNQKVYKLCDDNSDVKSLHLNDFDKNYILTTNNSKQYTVQVAAYPERTALLTLLVDLDKNTVTKIEK